MCNMGDLYLNGLRCSSRLWEWYLKAADQRLYPSADPHQMSVFTAIEWFSRCKRVNNKYKTTLKPFQDLNIDNIFKSTGNISHKEYKNIRIKISSYLDTTNGEPQLD